MADFGKESGNGRTGSMISIKNRKLTAGIIAGAVVFLIGILGGSYFFRGGGKKNFPSDGYILEVVQEEDAQRAAGLTFSAGTQYKGKFPSSYTFKDVKGGKNVVDAGSFIHYSDGSISAFCDGMAVNMQDAGQGFLDFYFVKEGMVMTKAQDGWEIDNNESTIAFPEMLWQLSTKKALVASEELTLTLSGRDAEKFSGYLEVTWIDKDIVQVANQDTAYQVVSTGGKITYKSGASLDLKQLAALGADGEVSFTLEELMADMQGGGITIQSKSAKEWQPPTFNIKTEDGKDGEDGKSGDEGETGEIGETGEEGGIGEDGKYGENGQQGAAGSAGAAGKKGGRPGSGSGGVGASGPDGANLGTIRIDNLKYDLGGVTVSLKTEDPDTTLLSNEGIVELREAATNREVWGSPKTGINFGDGNGNVDPIIVPFSGALSPDKEYVVIVKNGYEVEIKNNSGQLVKNKGQKVFATRSFYTSSTGVALEKSNVKENTVSLSLNAFLTDMNYSDYNAMFLIRSGDYWAVHSSNPTRLDTWVSSQNPLELKIADLLRQNSGGQFSMTSDIPYKIELYLAKTNQSADVWSSLKGSGVADQRLYKSSQVLEGRTLKKKPELGSVNAVLADGGYYDLSVDVKSDPDKSIKNYRFTVRSDSTEIKTFESTENKVKWYSGSNISAGSYEVSCEVTYYDNEKENVVKATSTWITITSAGSPSVSFVPYEYVDTPGSMKGWYRRRGNEKQLIGEDAEGIGLSGGASSSASRIWGDIVLMANGGNIRNQTLTIKITSSNTGNTSGGAENTTYNRIITVPMTGALAAQASFDIPIKCLGLKANTLYVISVWGDALDEESTGDRATSGTITPSVCFGSVPVKTDSLNGTPVDDTIAAFTFEVVNDTAHPERVVKIVRDNTKYQETDSGGVPIGQPRDYSDTTPGSEYYFERATARAVEIKVMRADGGGDLGTGNIIKYFSDSSYYGYGLSGAAATWQDSSKISDQERRFYRGPLVNSTFPDVYLTKDDFLSINLNPDSLGKFRLEAVALYDYSYGLIDDSKQYFRGGSQGTRYDEECFKDLDIARKTNFNRMVLNPLKKSNEKVLNVGQINLNDQPPRLSEKPYEAVEVTEIKNNADNKIILTGSTTTDPLLKSDTVVGFKVQSKFKDTESQTRSITYYGMTQDDYYQYMQATEGQENRKDIIKAWRDGDALATNKIKFEVTLKIGSGADAFEAPKNSDFYVPPLHVIFTKDETLLNRCRKTESGKTVYNAVKADSKAIFYTDQLSRGHCYVFAYTLRSMYGVNTSEGGIDDVNLWEFPYEIGSKTTGASPYTADQMQRSLGKTAFKETPRVVSYLSYTVPKDGENTGNMAVWEYIVYDPDGAMDKSSNLKTAYGQSYAGTAYAGTDEHLKSRLYQAYQGGGADTTLLGCSIANVPIPINETEKLQFYSQLWKILKQDDMGFGGFSDADFLKYQDELKKRMRVWEVTASDQNGKTLDHPRTGQGDDQSAYQIYLASQEFDDQYIEIVSPVSAEEGAEERAEAVEYLTRHENAAKNALTDTTHFAVETVEHKFDPKGSFTQTDITVDLSKGADSLEVKIDEASKTALGRNINRIAGFYYEFYDTDTPVNPAEEPLQYGFRPYSGGKAEIPFDKPEAGTEVAVKVWAVYDTGKAGADLGKVQSKTHTLQKEEPWKGSGDTSYYVVQEQKERMYWDLYNNTPGSWKLSASDSVYMVREDVVLPTADAYKRYLTTQWDETEDYVWDYRYTQQGGIFKVRPNAGKPLFKALAETLVTMQSTNGSLHQSGDYMIVTVPAARPNASGAVDGKSADNFHSADIDVTFSTQTVNTYVNQAEGYEKKIYFELCDASGNALKNINNRYFGFVKDDDVSSYANKNGTFRPTKGDVSYNDTESVEAYLVPEKTKTKYKIAVRNLEIGTGYQLKMYGMKGTEKNYINDSGSSGQQICISFRTASELRIGTGTGGEKFNAAFERTDYGKAAVTVKYGLTGGVKDLYADYEIVDTYGNVITSSKDGSKPFIPQKMMEYLGYPDMITETFHYYDTGQKEWVTTSYPVYTKTEGGRTSSYSPTFRGGGNVFGIESSALETLEPGRYRIKMSMYDKYHNLNSAVSENDYVPVLLNGGTGQKREPLTAAFTVPFQRDPSYTVEVGPPKKLPENPQKGTVTIGLLVQDRGYRLGAEKRDATKAVDWGKYKLRLWKKPKSHITEAKMSLQAAFVYGKENADWTDPSEPVLMTEKNYMISFQVEEGEVYRIELLAVDTGSEKPNEEQIVYNSDQFDRTKELLTINAIGAVNLGRTQWGKIDRATGELSVTVYKGNNLDTIRSVRGTLYNLSKIIAMESFSIQAGFGEEQSGQSVMPLDVSGILNEWRTVDDGSDVPLLENGDPLELTLQFYDEDDKPLAQQLTIHLTY